MCVVDRHPVGTHRAVTAGPGPEAGWAVAGSPPGDRRDRVQVPHRDGVDGPAGAVRFTPRAARRMSPVTSTARRHLAPPQQTPPAHPPPAAPPCGRAVAAARAKPCGRTGAGEHRALCRVSATASARAPGWLPGAPLSGGEGSSAAIERGPVPCARQRVGRGAGPGGKACTKRIRWGARLPATGPGSGPEAECTA